MCWIVLCVILYLCGQMFSGWGMRPRYRWEGAERTGETHWTQWTRWTVCAEGAWCSTGYCNRQMQIIWLRMIRYFNYAELVKSISSFKISYSKKINKSNHNDTITILSLMQYEGSIFTSLTPVLGRVCATGRVVFVQHFQNFLNPPKLLLNVPVNQLALRRRERVFCYTSHLMIH